MLFKISTQLKEEEDRLNEPERDINQPKDESKSWAEVKNNKKKKTHPNHNNGSILERETF